MSGRSSGAARVKESAPDLSEAAGPRDGDVVIARDSGVQIRFTLRQTPGAAQLHTASRDEAIRIARGFAQQAIVDVWYTNSGSHELLEAYRPDAICLQTS
jgi:hypothetical protein